MPNIDFNINDDDFMNSFVLDHPEDAPIIKVIGVGGGGGNAIKQMYQTGINDVSFVVCNTDKKALDDSPITRKLQLGVEGLGAGNNPNKGRAEAEATLEDINKMLSDGTRMVFITAGMGGGTGTGAAPVIAKAAKEKDILTVGIVTIPFMWEGKRKINQAIEGVEELSKNVDALLIINNERISKVYPGVTLNNGFKYANNVLTTAAKSIADIINMHGTINLDFNDVCTILRNGGVALMSTGEASGDNRIRKAIDEALKSPLLNDNEIWKAQRILLNIASSGDDNTGLRTDEMDEIHEFMDNLEDDYVCKWGLYDDPTLGDKVRITVLASGFGTKEAINGQGIDEARMSDTIDKYYRGLGQKGNKEYQLFIFNPEDLDDDNIVSDVENSPAYKRDIKTLNSIKQRQSVTTTNNQVTEDPVADDGTIRFL
ncbi:cell division protein FtsZ [Bacteroidales bacterium KHT7]|jgi:cell division protein FtsZ|uniref:cell division protein FtsZ n=1 Tax=unclassified Bacteroides TaxID=2646097 RepID=UPI000883618B|nr:MULTISPECIES: cell division protein FtsZ [unclassified Bacteroides]SDG55364.1 cell division protein FtsZ [Bacteroidales bacterium KHT7]